MNKKQYKQELKILEKEFDKLTEQIKDKFKTAALGFFDAYPALESFKFDAFISSRFNDGEANEYYVRSDAESIWINDIKYYNLEDLDEDEMSEAEKKAFDLFQSKLPKEISEFLDSLDSEYYQKMFGNSGIKVTREGIELEDYEDEY